MKVWIFAGVETEWVAANTEAEARDVLMRHYGIDQRDIDHGYESITSSDDLDNIWFRTDEWNEEADESVDKTAAEMMAGKTKPFVLGSTCH